MPHMCLSVRSNFSFISTVGLSLFRDRTVNCGTSCSVWFWFTFFWIWFRSRLHNDSFSPHRPTSWIEILIYYTCTGIYAYSSSQTWSMNIGRFAVPCPMTYMHLFKMSLSLEVKLLLGDVKESCCSMISFIDQLIIYLWCVGPLYMY